MGDVRAIQVYATFYAGFEQGGASLNLFADQYTDRHLFGKIVPAVMFMLTPMVRRRAGGVRWGA